MNRYIKAMEIGIAYEEKGISYVNLVEELHKQLNYKFTYAGELTFLKWFGENFDFSARRLDFETLDEDIDTRENKALIGAEIFVYIKYSSSNYIPSDMSYKRIDDLLNSEWFLKGDTAKQYLDYLELTDARKQAKQTSYFSIASILIAVTAIAIGIFQNNDSPQPPYDVKIIENNTKVKKLQKENDNLKEKLNMAEMMVKVLEETKN